MNFYLLRADWDLGVCLHYEMKRKQITKSPCLNQWIDLRVTYTVSCVLNQELRPRIKEMYNQSSVLQISLKLWYLSNADLNN
jgi:hypothetical protein